jgi:hypothetical protein
MTLSQQIKRGLIAAAIAPAAGESIWIVIHGGDWHVIADFIGLHLLTIPLVLVFALPIALLLERFQFVRWWLCTLAGLVVGSLLGAWLAWPPKIPGLEFDQLDALDRLLYDTSLLGLLPPKLWGTYIEGVAEFGALGALGGFAGWAAYHDS